MEQPQTNLLPTPRRLVYILFALAATGLALRIYFAIVFPNVHWPDEIFQTQEPAHEAAYGIGLKTWEYRLGMRSWVMPTVLAGIMRATAWMGTGSSGYILAIQVAFSLLSLTAIFFSYAVAKRYAGVSAGFAAAILTAFSAELIHFAPKALTEIAAAHILFPGLYFLLYAEKPAMRERFMIAGALLGTATLLRIHFVPVVALALVWACRNEIKQRWVPILVGAAAPALLFGLVDAITWKYPFQSIFMAFWQNIVEHQAARFGTEPWYYYLQQLWLHLGVVLVFAALAIRRVPLLAVLVVVLVGSHSVIGHKEYRFIYPAVPLLLTMAAIGISEIADLLRRRSQIAAVAVVALATLACTAFMYRQSRKLLPWVHYASNLRAFIELSKRDDVCGVGLWGVAWPETGGYTYLHHNVPIYLSTRFMPWFAYHPDPMAVFVGRWASLHDASPAFNYIVAGYELPAGSGYEQVQCWPGTCIFKRPGGCTALPHYTVSEVVRAAGG